MNFDRHAHQYDQDLERGIRLSGEGKDFFARGRLAAVADHFAREGFAPRRMIAFGCGVGTNIAGIRARWPEVAITGLDTSEESLRVARAAHGEAGARFMTPAAYQASETDTEGADWLFCAGVLHHVPPGKRTATLAAMRDLLRPGGRITIFDNNPWNPGARLVMRRIPFDRGAVMQGPYRLRSMLAELGFDAPALRFLFIFPRLLAPLRALEPSLARLPLGAQYGVFARTARSPGSPPGAEEKG